MLAAGALVATLSLHARLGRDLRWQRASGDPALSAEAAWADLRETARGVGLSWDAAATPRATAQRLAASASLKPEHRASLDHLVWAIEQARYARRPRPVESLRADTATLRRSIARSAKLRRQVAAYLLPTRLRDAAAEANQRTIDGFAWFDLVGERPRTSTQRATAGPPVHGTDLLGAPAQSGCRASGPSGAAP